MEMRDHGADVESEAVQLHSTNESDEWQDDTPSTLEPVTSEEGQKEPPDGGYGWVVVVASFVNLVFLSSALMAFAVFFTEFKQNLYTETLTTQVSIIGAIQTGFMFYFSILSGAMISRYGCRPVAILGAIFTSLGFIVSSHAYVFSISPFGRYVVICIFYGAVSGMGISLGMTSTIVIVHQYFTTRRALASGLSLCGLSIGSMIVGPFLTFLIREYTLRGALLIQGGLILNGIPLGILFRPWCPVPKRNSRSSGRSRRSLRSSDRVKSYSNSLVTDNDRDSYPDSNGRGGGVSRRQSQHGDRNASLPCAPCSPCSIDLCCQRFEQIFPYHLFRNADFVLYCVGNFFLTFGSMSYVQHLINASSQIMPHAQSVNLFTILNSVTLVSRIIASLISDWKSVNRVLEFSVITIMSGIAVSLTAQARNFTHMVILAGVIVGFSMGASTVLQITILVDLVGTEILPRASGIFNVFIGTSAMLGMALTGKMVDNTGNYNRAFAINGCVEMFGGILIMLIFIRGRLRKRRNRACREPPVDNCTPIMNGHVHSIHGNSIHGDNGIHDDGPWQQPSCNCHDNKKTGNGTARAPVHYNDNDLAVGPV